MNPKLMIALSCVLALPGAAMAKKPHRHHHHRTAHHHHRATAAPQWTAIASYTQGGGFGGPLSIERSDGSVVKSFFGEKADLRCGPSADGPFAPCDKANLVAGTPVADAAHGLNTYGNDVWLSVDLITTPVAADPPGDAPPPATDPTEPPPPTEPAPEPQPAPPAIAVVDSYDADGRLLAFDRLNNDEKPVIRLADDVVVTCALVKDGKLAGMKDCSTSDLVAGAQIAAFGFTRVDNVPLITTIELLVPGS